jgi:hypothetical protein
MAEAPLVLRLLSPTQPGRLERRQPAFLLPTNGLSDVSLMHC